MDTKQKSAAKVNPASAGSVIAVEGDQMEQIRELMFGGVVRDLERRLKELEDRVETEAARITSEYSKRVSALESRLDPQIERLQAQLRQESAVRTSALDDVDLRFNQVVRTQRGELNTILQRHEDDAASSEARARAAMSQLDEQIKQSLAALKESLMAARAQLGGEKVAREDLADLMAELSLRLRGAQEPSNNA